MSAEYERLVSYLRIFLQHVAPSGQIDFSEMTLEDRVLAIKLGVHWFLPSRTFPQGAYVCSEEAGHELLRLAWVEKSPAAWRLAYKILGHRIALRENVPDGLLTLAALFFSGQAVPPKNDRKSQTWEERILKYFLCVFGKIELERTGDDQVLHMTRSTTKKPGKSNESVCDAVAQVLREWGVATSHRSVQQIWNDPSERDAKIREDLKEWVKSLKEANATDPIAFLASSVSWLHSDELDQPSGVSIFKLMTETKK